MRQRQSAERQAAILDADLMTFERNAFEAVAEIRLYSVDASVLNGFRNLQQPGEPDLITELIDLFLKDAAGQIALLESADCFEAQAVKKLAYKLKGNSLHVGARRMAAASARLEENAADFNKIPLLITQIKSEFENASRILSAMRKSD